MLYLSMVQALAKLNLSDLSEVIFVLVKIRDFGVFTVFNLKVYQELLSA